MHFLQPKSWDQLPGMRVGIGEGEYTFSEIGQALKGTFAINDEIGLIEMASLHLRGCQKLKYITTDNAVAPDSYRDGF